MARSDMPSMELLPHVKLSAPATSITREHLFRRICAWLLLIFLSMGELGAVWDREWHAYVGRDQFWTPPHTLIYTCVSGAGLLALAVVLLETSRYYRKRPGVDDTSTVTVFGIFHAPLGFCVLGFGALIALVAAPLDNYWHELYGIDIALWAPFHMMGVTGGLIGILGMVYVFASEAAIERIEKTAKKHILGVTALELGIILTLASFLDFVLTGFLQFPLVTIGTIQISTYPIPLLMGGIFCLVAALQTTRRPGMASVLTLILVGHTVIIELFIPWAIRTAVSQQGIPFRNPNEIPYFQIGYALLPLVFLLAALVLDILAYRKQQKADEETSKKPYQTILPGILLTPTILILAPLCLINYSEYAPIILPAAGIPLERVTLVLLGIGVLVVSLLAGMAGALMGLEFGDIWRLSRK